MSATTGPTAATSVRLNAALTTSAGRDGEEPLDLRSARERDRVDFAPRHLDLEYAQATSDLSPESCLKLRSVCRAEEWSAYAPRILAEVARAEPELRLRIHVLRGEYALAGALIATMKCNATFGGWAGDYHVFDEPWLLTFDGGVVTRTSKFQSIPVLLVRDLP